MNTLNLEDVSQYVNQHSDQFHARRIKDRSRVINVLTGQYIAEFCDVNGDIDWAKLLSAISGNYDLDRFFGTP